MNLAKGIANLGLMEGVYLCLVISVNKFTF